MKKKKNLQITTASGNRRDFSEEKVAASLRRSGAGEQIIDQIISIIKEELHEGITTKEVYRRAFNLLRKKDRLVASRYKLKKAIYELGPTGYPFEHFVAAILRHSGYLVEVSEVLQGECVTHEVDVIAEKDGKKILIECKFHGDQGRFCNVKVPLYIHSRFEDIRNHQLKRETKIAPFDEGWVVTNTRFTADALVYGKCAGLKLVSWDTPKGESLKERIDHLGLYPITVSTILSKREKQFLLSREVVLCRDLLKEDFLLDQLEISAHRKKKILNEMHVLCKH
ncbi:restriction endonuclease [Salinimicrobium soli]|uniref:restriction endonuclease n=1 Tax=Salinimicrobium soli TaxID=1254399 RepID=UPI003AAF0384